MSGSGNRFVGKRRLWVAATALVCVLLAAVSALVPLFVDSGAGGDAAAAAAREQFKYPAMKTVSALVALVEKPDARRVFLAGDAAEDKAYFDFFTHAGCIVATEAPQGRYDIVFTTVEDLGAADAPRLDALAALVAERGVLACAFDAKNASVADMKAFIDAFQPEDAHLWMPGESSWVLVGRLVQRKVKLSAMLDVFAWDGIFEDLAEASCSSVPEAFASYAGDRTVFSPPLSSVPPDMTLSPEILVTQEPPDIEWITAGDIDDDILAKAAQEIRSMQVVRRQILQGNMLSKIGKTDDAIEKWHLAFLRNPNDTMLLERLYRLAVNARACREIGNFKTAAKCYETMVCINPLDTLAITEYANCLRSVGQFELADEAMKRVKELKTHESAGNAVKE